MIEIGNRAIAHLKLWAVRVVYKEEVENRTIAHLKMWTVGVYDEEIGNKAIAHLKEEVGNRTIEH